MGRPKAWEFNNQKSTEQKSEYKKLQREIIQKTIREYNSLIPIIQNLDIGHTNPQIPLPYGKQIRIDSGNKKIFTDF